MNKLGKQIRMLGREYNQNRPSMGKMLGHFGRVWYGFRDVALGGAHRRTRSVMSILRTHLYQISVREEWKS